MCKRVSEWIGIMKEITCFQKEGCFSAFCSANNLFIPVDCALKFKGQTEKKLRKEILPQTYIHISMRTQENRALLASKNTRTRTSFLSNKSNK